MTLTKAVSTAVAARSFQDAAKLLQINTDLVISSRHLQNLAREVGDELVQEQREKTEAFRARRLNTPHKPAEPPIPLAVVTGRRRSNPDAQTRLRSRSP